MNIVKKVSQLDQIFVIEKIEIFLRIFNLFYRDFHFFMGKFQLWD